MQQMLTAELAGIVGSKHAKLGEGRVGNWHGTTTGQVVLGSRKVTVRRPRGRYVDGGEVPLWEYPRWPDSGLCSLLLVLLFPFGGGEPAEGGVYALVIVAVDPREDRTPGIGMIPIDLTVDAFAFECSPERLRDGIIEAVADTAKRRAQPLRRKPL